MSEDLPDQNPEQGEEFSPRDAIWHAPEGDKRVKVTGVTKTASGNVYYSIEGSGLTLVKEQVEFVEGQEESADQSEENKREGLGIEKQLAVQKIGELLNERQAKAVKAKEAGKKGNHDAKIALYESLRKAVNSGNFDVPVQNTTVRKFVDELFEQQKKQTDELIAVVDTTPEGKQKHDKQQQLEKAYGLYDLAEAAQIALEKVEASLPPPASEPESQDHEAAAAPPSVEEEKPKTGREKKQNEQSSERQKTEERTPRPEFKFNTGEILKVKTKNRQREYDWRVKKSFVGKENKVFVVLEDPNGKSSDRVKPQDLLLQWNPRENQESQDADDANAEDAMDEPGSSDRRQGDGSDHRKGDNGDGHENGEIPEDEYNWLDPRRIGELKAQFAESMGDNRSIDEEAKQHLKTILIHREIDRARDYAGQVQERHKMGSVPAYPSQKIIDRMAGMMDWEDDKLQKDIELGRFRIGQEVKIMKSDGSVEDGWIVKSYHRQSNKVLVQKGRELSAFSPSRLEEFQEVANPSDDKTNLENLKPYFKGPAKIKTNEGFVEGQFQGYRPGYGLAEGKVHYADASGRRLGDTTVEEFLGWQSEKTNTELEAEKWAEIEEKLGKFSKGQKVKVRDTEETQWLEGYTFVEYSPEEKAITIADPDGKLIPIRDLELFIKWQEDPSGDDSIKEDEPEPVGGEGEPTSAPDTEPAISATKPKYTRKERREKKREEKYARQDERDKALNEWLARVGGKWEQQSLFKRLALTGPLGFFATGVALSTMPGWLLTYGGGKSFTDRQVRLMRERQAREEAEEIKAREKAERESRKKKKDNES